MRDRVIWGGKYAIFGEIASGGMATVYLAARLGRSSEIPEVVALKKLSAQLAKQPEFVAMFLDEAHLAARVRHPNVVTTYEFVRTSEGLGIVMDFVVGESFVELLRGQMDEADLVPLPIAAAIVAGALEGLHAAHETRDDTGRAIGLVHRDVSPHNILVGADGVARVIDFGIAKAAGRLQTTDVGIIKGKFAYMAPEQIHGAAVDRTTDVYAAGIVLWEALAGRKLFRANTNEELLIQRSAGSVSIPPPRAMNSGRAARAGRGSSSRAGDGPERPPLRRPRRRWRRRSGPRIDLADASYGRRLGPWAGRGEARNARGRAERDLRLDGVDARRAARATCSVPAFGRPAAGSVRPDRRYPRRDGVVVPGRRDSTARSPPLSRLEHMAVAPGAPPGGGGVRG